MRRTGAMEFNPQFTSICNTLFPSKDSEAAVILELQKRSKLYFASCIETKTSKAKRIEVSLA